jgi:hypothetical protein
MNTNPHLKIVWTIRDPKDMILSKFKRGQAGSDGNSITADDATPEGCVEDITHMFNVYNFIKDNYPDRIHLVKMEYVILDFENEINNVCEFLGINFVDDMKNFTDRYRNKHKTKRYKTLDTSQVGLWSRRNEIYSGFFKNNAYNIKDVGCKLNNITKFFGYETIGDC